MGDLTKKLLLTLLLFSSLVSALTLPAPVITSVTGPTEMIAGQESVFNVTVKNIGEAASQFEAGVDGSYFGVEGNYFDLPDKWQFTEPPVLAPGETGVASITIRALPDVETGATAKLRFLGCSYSVIDVGTCNSKVVSILFRPQQPTLPALTVDAGVVAAIILIVALVLIGQKMDVLAWIKRHKKISLAVFLLFIVPYLLVLIWGNISPEARSDIGNGIFVIFVLIIIVVAAFVTRKTPEERAAHDAAYDNRTAELEAEQDFSRQQENDSGEWDYDDLTGARAAREMGKEMRRTSRSFKSKKRRGW